MIYLFCNEKYGAAFIEAAKKYSEEQGTNISVIYSARRRLRRNLIKRIISSAKWSIKNRLEERNLSRERGISIVLVGNVNSFWFYRRIRKEDCGVVAGFNQIFKQPTISRFKSLVNFHPSILPLYRGPVPSYWSIKNGEEKTGYTLHAVTEKIDDGEILFQEEINIGTISKPDILDHKIASHAAITFWRYLDHVQRGNDWHKVRLDAYGIYNTHIDYASFPNRSSG